MANGDVLLDVDGNVILDDDGDVMLSDGVGDACCCGPDCDTTVSAEVCSDCTGGTPDGYTVSVSNVDLCTGCVDTGFGSSKKFDDPQAGASVNGTRCYRRNGSSSQNPCIYTSHSITGATVVKSYALSNTCDEADLASTGTDYLRYFTVDVSGGNVTVTLEISGGGAGTLFYGTTTFAAQDPARPCYFVNVVIANTIALDCDGSADGVYTMGGGGSATVSACC